MENFHFYKIKYSYQNQIRDGGDRIFLKICIIGKKEAFCDLLCTVLNLHRSPFEYVLHH